jgi:L-lactate dehydrogenase
VTAALLRWVLRGERRILTVSRVQEAALGMRDLAISSTLVREAIVTL